MISMKDVEEKKRSNTRSINMMLVGLFNSVLTTEAKAVITEEFSDITENDMHIIDAVGTSTPKMSSEIAKAMGVTAGTLTVNLNSLETKGYIIRERGTQDKRVVYIKLTERGRKAFFHHRDFHKKMIKAAIDGFNEDELEVLKECLEKLSVFFGQYD